MWVYVLFGALSLLACFDYFYELGYIYTIIYIHTFMCKSVMSVLVTGHRTGQSYRLYSYFGGGGARAEGGCNMNICHLPNYGQ
jgi:hypothetical protein